MKKQFRWAYWMILAALVLSACSPAIPGTGGDSAATQQARVLEAARATTTMQAMQAELARLQTQVALGTPASAVETPAQPSTLTETASAVPPTSTPSLTPTVTPSLTPTFTPTVTPSLTPTLTPTVTPSPTPTPIPLPCRSAAYVDDVSIPPGTTLAPGTSFIKTWRIRNAGSCAWDSGYNLVFFDGNLMNAAGINRLPQIVYPGQTVDISVEMYAPTSEGTYRSYWMLRDPAGVLFGLGVDQQYALYLEVQVKKPDNFNPLDFAATYCMAEWTTGAGRIPCQGQRSDPRGYVRHIDNPVLESGYQDDEPVLQTFPQMVNGGLINGKYPALRIENGWHFRSIIGCANQSPACDVTFQLNYQVSGGAVQSLGSWKEVYDEKFQAIDVDLSALAGQEVQLILTVYANGSPHQDYAQWLAPRIISTVEWQQ